MILEVWNKRFGHNSYYSPSCESAYICFTFKCSSRWCQKHVHRISPMIMLTSAQYTWRKTIEQILLILNAQKFKKKSLWVKAVTYTVYTLNQCLTRVLRVITPKETWSGRRPCIAHMCLFGYIPYAMVLDEKRGKLDVKGTKCVFLVYWEGNKHIG